MAARRTRLQRLRALTARMSAVQGAGFINNGEELGVLVDIALEVKGREQGWQGAREQCGSSHIGAKCPAPKTSAQNPHPEPAPAQNPPCGPAYCLGVLRLPGVLRTSLTCTLPLPCAEGSGGAARAHAGC